MILTAILLLFFLASSTTVFLVAGINTQPSAGTSVLYRTFLWTSPLFAAALWFAGTAWLWRSKRIDLPEGNLAESDLTDLVRCGECGYSLVGLREVRCPECGWQSTVDDAVRRGMAEFIELRAMPAA